MKIFHIWCNVKFVFFLCFFILLITKLTLDYVRKTFMSGLSVFWKKHAADMRYSEMFLLRLNKTDIRFLCKEY